MPDESFGEKMEPFVERLRWDFEHLFDRKSFNPWVTAGEGDSKPKNRTGFEDLFHALKNIPVEALRIWRAK